MVLRIDFSQESQRYFFSKGSIRKIRNYKVLHVSIEERRSRRVLKALARAQRGSAAPCGSGSWGPGLPAGPWGRGCARRGPAGAAAGTAGARVMGQARGDEAGPRASQEHESVSRGQDQAWWQGQTQPAVARPRREVSQPLGRGLGAAQRGPWPGTGGDMAAARVGPHLRRGRALGLRLKTRLPQKGTRLG